MTTERTPPITWHALQERLRACTTEQEVEALMAAEAAGPRRHRWLMRMHGRRSALRNEREVAEISRIAARMEG